MNPLKSTVRHSTQIGQTRVEWLYGAGCVQYTVYAQFGRGGTQKISTDVTTDEIQEAAKTLRENPHAVTFAYQGKIRRGKGWQAVPIYVPRAVLIGIADALAGAIDADDAAHRFHHWENPGTTRPCSSCRETRDADDFRVDGARAQLVCAWTAALGVPAETVERLLLEFSRLPRKALR